MRRIASIICGPLGTILNGLFFIVNSWVYECLSVYTHDVSKTTKCCCPWLRATMAQSPPRLPASESSLRTVSELGSHPPATVVDHKIPHKGDSVLFWNQENWQSLCGTCHDSVKQAEERTGWLRGADKDGVPLNAGHHWHGGPKP